MMSRVFGMLNAERNYEVLEELYRKLDSLGYNKAKELVNRSIRWYSVDSTKKMKFILWRAMKNDGTFTTNWNERVVINNIPIYELREAISQLIIIKEEYITHDLSGIL